MKPLLIRGAAVVVEGGLRRVDVLVREGKIAGIGDAIQADDATLIGAEGLTVGPGFIDIHTHGGGGTSFLGENDRAVADYSDWAPSAGVTGFLASTAGASPDGTARQLESLRESAGDSGAEFLGIHLEGPFLNAARRGAFLPSMLRPPNVSEMERYLAAADGTLRLVTIAPELPGAWNIVTALNDASVAVAIGHSDARSAEARESFVAGITHVTHLFNAMRPFHHREGGTIAAALLDATVTSELILDGVHVSPDTVRLAYRSLGPERTVVVTDNVSFAGTESSEGQFAEDDIHTARGAATRKDGTLVGSIQTMDRHFRNAIEFLSIDISEAFRICSENPAGVIGAQKRKGRIALGYDADLVLLDRDLQVRSTICRGELAFTAASR